MTESNDSSSVLDAIRTHRVVMIYRGLTPKECLEVSRVLYDAGIRLFEVTMNSSDTEDAISLLSSELDSDAYIGAGTVLTAGQVESAHEAGASYIISPNTNVDVIRRTKELDMVSVPGAMTPTEAELAVRAGGDMVKVFPINVLGPEFITQLKGPLDEIELLACGGLQVEMVEDLCKVGCRAIGIGVQLLGEGLVEAQNWELLRERAREYIQASDL